MTIVLLVAAGCGQAATSDPPPSAPPSSSTVATASAPPSDTASPSPEFTSSSSPTASELSPTPTGSPTTPSPTPTIDPSTGERKLGLGDFFDPTTNWSEDRFGIPVVGEVTGIGSEITGCDKDEAYELEFRNDYQYKLLNLMAGPSGKSEDSSKKLVVAVYNNEDFIDAITVPYGQVAPLRNIKIEKVSALKFRMYLDDENGCNTQGMFGVLYDIRVA